MKYAYLSIVVIIAVLGQISLKKGLNSLGKIHIFDFFSSLLQVLTNPFVVLAFCCYAVGLFFYLFLLSRYDLSNIYPITSGMTLAAIAVFSVIVFKEPLLWNRLMGIVLIAAGIFLMEK